jgi:hypothetical protein
VAFRVAGGGFEPPTFGLCDLTHLSVRLELYVYAQGVLAIQSLRLTLYVPPTLTSDLIPRASNQLGSDRELKQI